MPVAWPAIDEAAITNEQSAAPARRISIRRPRRRRTDRQGRSTGLLARVLRTSYLDPLFERPDVVEDDYYRFLHQPRG